MLGEVPSSNAVRKINILELSALPNSSLSKAKKDHFLQISTDPLSLSKNKRKSNWKSLKVWFFYKKKVCILVSPFIFEFLYFHLK